MPRTAQTAPTPHEQSWIAALRSPRRLRIEVLGGLVVAFALIPEAISFSIIAGVDPRVGLFASFAMAVTIAFTGGRPAMISAAAGSVALVVAPLAKQYGPDYLIAAVVLAGIFQMALGGLGVSRLLRFIPHSVMVGFVNALAILIFLAQLPHLIDVPWAVYPMVAAGLVVIVALPRLTTVVPAPLVAIVLITAAALAMGLDLPSVGDEGELPESLPSLLIPDVPATWETLTIIAPFALTMALVGLLESLLTAQLVDEITDTRSDKRRESIGQGVGNIAAGLFGGIGGCAMIGQTMINVKGAGSRTRLSTFCAGVFLLILVVGLGDIVGRIPMAALVAVMIMVSVGTMNWHCLRPGSLRRMPRSETAVMLVTVAVTVATSNLAYGVIVGVIAAMALFARRVAQRTGFERVEAPHHGVSVPHAEPHAVPHAVPAGEGAAGGGAAGPRVYRITGELFFASSADLVHRFDYAGDPAHVVIDLTGAEIWDASTVVALDAVRGKYAARGTRVDIVGLDGASLERHERLSGHLAAAD